VNVTTGGLFTVMPVIVAPVVLGVTTGGRHNAATAAATTATTTTCQRHHGQKSRANKPENHVHLRHSNNHNLITPRRYSPHGADNLAILGQSRAELTCVTPFLAHFLRLIPYW
jgi:hypothetical protein